MSRPQNLSASDAKARLQAGNQRYVQDRTTGERRDSARRAELTGGQAPYATIIACADIRVGPELVFDEGLCDIFVIRVAGNINSPDVLGSVEYASLHLGVNLVVVLGHQSCGAVGAAVAAAGGADKHGNSIDSLVDAILPAVHQAKESGADDLSDASIRANAALQAQLMGGDEAAMAGLAELGCEVVPAYYSLESGEVTFL